MNALSPQPSILETSQIDTADALAILQGALQGADDGELFLERSESEMLVFDDGRLKSAAYDATEGFGLRVVAGEKAGYAHSSEVSLAAIRRSAEAAAHVRQGYEGVAADGPRQTNTKLYGEDDPLAHPVFGDKASLLEEIDAEVAYLTDKGWSEPVRKENTPANRRWRITAAGIDQAEAEGF